MPGRAGAPAATLDGMTDWRQGLWVPIWVLGGVFASSGRGSWRAVAAVVVGALVGAAWQVLARRDPTDRLSWFAVGTLLLGLGLTLGPLLSGSTIRSTRARRSTSRRSQQPSSSPSRCCADGITGR